MAREYASTGSEAVKDQIVSVSSQNPRWIMIITQTYSVISIVMLASKFLL
ncbi:hypothetical protein KEJ15_03870 [Candidatus Bathyarchaeota archaeon]|nr:hypothetical protein [Candidatus Bathyarchaeota archaeon]